MLTKVLNPFRPYIHRSRVAFAKMLGIHSVLQRLEAAARESSMLKLQFDQNQLFAVADRIALLESQVNWRLFGLPARIENIKLEQLALLAGSGNIEKALTDLQEFSRAAIPFERIALAPKSISGPGFILAGDVERELPALLQGFQESPRIKIAIDSYDLFGSDREPEVRRNQSLLKIGLASIPACFVREEFDFIWLSTSLERMTTIQSKVLLDRCQQGLNPGKTCAGLFQDYNTTDPGHYWLDPRRMRPVTKPYIQALLESAHFDQIEFSALDNGWTQFKAFKK